MDFLKGTSAGAADGSAQIEVLEENWDTVQVFTRCRQDYVAVGIAGVHALGFNAREVESGCHLAGLAPERWPEVSDQVLKMGCIAAEALNNRSGP